MIPRCVLFIVCTLCSPAQQLDITVYALCTQSVCIVYLCALCYAVGNVLYTAVTYVGPVLRTLGPRCLYSLRTELFILYVLCVICAAVVWPGWRDVKITGCLPGLARTTRVFCFVFVCAVPPPPRGFEADTCVFASAQRRLWRAACCPQSVYAAESAVCPYTGPGI